MTVESATYISQLSPTSPTGSDPKSEADNHLRLIKSVLQSQFPSLGSAAVTATAAQINSVVATGGLLSVGTSTTSNSIGTGSKTFTTQTGLGFAAGQAVRIQDNASLSNYMLGTVSSYTTATGSIVVTVNTAIGSGTIANWSISLTTINPDMIRRAVTSADTIVASDDGGFVDCTSGTFTLSITAAATLGLFYCYVRNSGSGTVTLDPSGSDTIDSGSTLTLGPGQTVLLHCDSVSAFRTFSYQPSLSLTTTAISSDLTLTSASARIQSLSSSVLGRAVILPDATTLRVGDRFTLQNTGSLPIGIRSNGNTLIGACVGTVNATVLSVSTAAGTWDVSGSGYQPGLVTVDSTFSTTYTASQYHQCADLGSGISIHFIGLAANGFAAYCLDSTGRAVGTPVAVSTTSGATPRALYAIDSTRAVAFWSESADTKCAVITYTSGTSISVGSVATLSGGSILGSHTVGGTQRIVALSSTLYLMADITSATLYAAAMEVSGTSCAWGSRSDTAITNSIANSGQLFALTGTTALITYLVGASAPYANTARVLSVSGTAVTANAAATVTGVESNSNSTVCPAVLLSPTVALVVDNGNTTNTVKAAAVTISSTTATANTAITVESSVTGLSFSQLASISAATRNGPLRALTSSTAALVYVSYDGTDYVSRAVVLSESGGTVTAGTVLKGSLMARPAANTTGQAFVLTGDATTIPSAMISTSGSGAAKFMVYHCHAISGTTITSGQSAASRAPLIELDTSSLGVRLTNDFLVIGRANISTPQAEVLRFANGGASNRGRIDLPLMAGTTSVTLVNYSDAARFSNGTLLIGKVFPQSGSTDVIRIARVEVAA